jgi:CheY-like chemotaxis protein
MAHILIIDDDESVRDILLQTLRAAGHSVVVANNGLEGLILFRSATTDLVITDMMMPYDGLATIHILRNECPDIRIIAMSGGGTFRLDYARGAGAVTTLAKPFTTDQVMLAVSEALARPSTLKSTS